MAHETDPSSPSQNSSERRGLLYILLSVFAFLSGWSLSRLRTPSDDDGKPVHPEDDTPPESGLGQLESPIAPQIPLTPTQHYQPDRRKDNTPSWKKTAEIVAIGIAGGLLIINIVALCAARKAANAAKESVELARMNADMDQRAWVGVSDISSSVRKSEDWTVSFMFKNTGKTPAKDFVIRGAGERVAKGQKPIKEEIRLPGRGVIVPDGIFHSELKVSGLYDWTSADLVIHGRIEYESVFGHGHWTTFCYHFVSDGNTGKGGFAPCDSGNDIDGNPP